MASLESLALTALYIVAGASACVAFVIVTSCILAFIHDHAPARGKR